MKTIIRESFAMIVLIFAIMLILITIFFDYIKSNSIEITGATYQLSKEEQKIFAEKQNYLESQNKIVLSSSYSITEEDLQNYKASGDYKSGQSNPFDEVLVTEIIHNADGSVHYRVTDPTTTVSNTTSSISGNGSGTVVTNSNNNSNTNKTNTTNESNYFANDISAPSVGSGSIIPPTGK